MRLRGKIRIIQKREENVLAPKAGKPEAHGGDVLGEKCPELAANDEGFVHKLLSPEGTHIRAAPPPTDGSGKT